MEADPQLEDILRCHAERKGALLPVLHDVQAAHGHISDAAMRRIAQALNLTRAEVHGVVSFYHDFRTVPEHRPVIQLCRAEACQARGSDAVAAAMHAAAGQAVCIEHVSCLGLCSAGPAALINGDLFARLDAGQGAKLVERVR